MRARDRRDLSAWLHDGPVQNLLFVQQELAEAERGDPEALRRAREILIATVRELRGELHPGLEELPALAAALALRGGFTVAVEIDPRAAGVNDPLVLSLARELLTNVVRHAEATRVAVTVRRERRSVRVEVVDDGRGFDGRGSDGHFGLSAAAQRARLEIDSAPGHGTTVRAVIRADRAASPPRRPRRDHRRRASRTDARGVS